MKQASGRAIARDGVAWRYHVALRMKANGAPPTKTIHGEVITVSKQ